MYAPLSSVWHGLRASIGALFERLPARLLFVAVLLSAFSYGVATVIYEIFPYRHIAEGLKTYHIIAEGLHTGRMMFKARRSGPPNALHAGVSSSIAAREAAANRIELIEGDNLSDPVLWFGGAWQFTDVCPGYGCLAVAFDTNGKVAHAWPWRPHEMERAATSSAVKGGGAERALPAPFVELVYPFAMAQYANGHLLVVLRSFGIAVGLARIDADGYPVWYRRDASHHWPQMLEDDMALVPGSKYGDGSLSFKIGQERVDVPCTETVDGRLRYDRVVIHLVNLIDGDGRLLRSLNLTDALLESDYAPILNYNLDRPWNCNPLHLNFIRRIENDAGGVPGIMPGDLVASFRNLDAFAVIDPESGRIKRLVRGSFKSQHSVQHLEGSTFVMFDNQSGKELSRLLAVDLATGLETTVFPNANTPANLHLYSEVAGHVSVSPDRRRAIVSYSTEGVALEVRLSDGAVLSKFTSLHDISRIDAFTDDAKYIPAPWPRPLRRAKAAVFHNFGLSYIPPERKYRFSRVSGEPAARGVWDVYLDETSLTYHKQPCIAEDTASRFFLHVFPSDEADLPEGRELHGFDNRDFDFHGIRVDDGCFARTPLPDYAFGTMRTGQYIIGGEALWKVEIERRQEAETH